MNICIIGDSITSLTLAKNLVSKQINIFLYYKKQKVFQSKNRTIGISRNNLEFIDKKIIKINKKIIWNIDQIEIYTEKLLNEKILNFQKDKNERFSIIENNIFYSLLNNSLKKNKFFKKCLIKNKNTYKEILKNKNYDLIINCESNNEICKKYFNKRINKNYNSCAYTTILNHSNIANKKAVQIFTKYGPLAFLPLSNNKTSVVFSLINKLNNFSEIEIKNLIYKYNKIYKIKNFNKIEKFPLSYSLPRKYFYKNIMLFGDSLHKIHPLAGQGFNMTLRDIKIFSSIIDEKIDLGLQLDSSICKKFERENKHFNYIFSSSIDFIYEFFNLNSKINNTYLDQILKYVGKNKFFNKIISSYANKGF